MKRFTPLLVGLLLASVVSVKAASDSSEQSKMAYDQLMSSMAGQEQSSLAEVLPVAGRSSIDCIVDSDCPMGMYCHAHQCEELQAPAPSVRCPRCAVDSDCLPGQYCRAFRCEELQAP